jgi:hypothetical protein
MASDVLNRIGMFLDETGNTGTLVCDTLISELFNTPVQAGAVNGRSYWWLVEEGQDYMLFEGVWNSGTNAITVGTIWKSKILGVAGTTRLTLAGNATLRSPTPAELFENILRGDKQQNFIDSVKAQFRANIEAPPFDALAHNGMQVGGEVNQEYGTTARTGLTNVATYVADGVQLLSVGSQVLTYQMVSDAPPGYSSSHKLSVTTANASPGSNDYTTLIFPVEGYRVARMRWGAVGASPISIGIWIKANRIGMYSGVLRNLGASRVYPFTFTVTTANTWQLVPLTVLGDTSGTWGKTNGIGLALSILVGGGASIAGGTPGAWTGSGSSYFGATGSINGFAATSDTFQVAGLIMLPGIELPSAERAPFIMRPYEQELQLCRRYFEILGAGAAGAIVSTTTVDLAYRYGVEKRTSPTLSGLKSAVSIYAPTGGYIGSTGSTYTFASHAATDSTGFIASISGFTGLTVGQGVLVNDTNIIKSDARL